MTHPSEARSNWVDASVASLLGAVVGALSGAWINIYARHDYDAKFAEARGIPYVLDSFALGAMALAALGVGMVLLWVFRPSLGERLRLWHYGLIGLLIPVGIDLFWNLLRRS